MNMANLAAPDDAAREEEVVSAAACGQIKGNGSLSRWSLPSRPQSASSSALPNDAGNESAYRTHQLPNATGQAGTPRATMFSNLSGGAGEAGVGAKQRQQPGSGPASPRLISPRSVRSDSGGWDHVRSNARIGVRGGAPGGRSASAGRRGSPSHGARGEEWDSPRSWSRGQAGDAEIWEQDEGDVPEPPLTEAERDAALRAASVTVLPPSGRAAALRSMPSEERAATIRWMDPADVPQRLRPAGSSPTTAVERSLRRGDTAAAAEALQRVADPDQVRRLVASMGAAERRAVLGRVPVGWHEEMLSRMDVGGVAESLAGMEPEQARILLQALPPARRAAVRSAMSSGSGAAAGNRGPGPSQVGSAEKRGRSQGGSASRGGGVAGMLDLSWLTIPLGPKVAGSAY